MAWNYLNCEAASAYIQNKQSVRNVVNKRTQVIPTTINSKVN
jgi:hypothetical protein